MNQEHRAAAARDPYLLAQVRESFGRIVYSQKKHEKQADICFVKYRWQQGALIAFTAITSGTFLASVFGLFDDAALSALGTSFVALIVSWMSLGTTTFNFADESDAHKELAARLWDVRESYISLISDLMSDEISTAEGRERRDQLQEESLATYSVAPRTSRRAYKRAQNGLKHNEELTFSVREIDLFLPEALRIEQQEATA